jgi:hypothetical protein
LEGQHLAKSFFNTGLLGAAGTDAAPSDDQFNRVSFLSHFEGSNNGVNNAFDDGSSSNHTITANGNVTQGSFGPFARPDGEWGWNFDGDGDSLTFTNDATMSLDGDYTFELFFNARTIVQDTQHPNTILIGGTQLYIHSSDRYISWYANGGNIVHSASNAILTNVWNHVAVVRSGSGTNNTSIYLNGTRVQQATNTATLGASSGTARIGSYTASGGNFDGHISNLRLLKGTALYSGSSITVPTSALTAITNTKLLTCQSNRFIDNSSTGFALTPVGNPAVTAFGPFLTSSVYKASVNGASAYLDGSGDYLQADNSADWDLGTGNFTWECYAYITDITRTQWFFSVFSTGSGQNAWGLRLEANGTLNAYFDENGDESVSTIGVAAGSSGLTENAWHHIACVKNGTGSNNIQIYVDGVSKVTGTFGAIFDTNLPFRVGRQGSNTYAQYFLGYISDVRIVKGTAVYTGNFTPPTAPLTAITNTKLLLNMADGQAIDSAAQNNLTLYGNAKISTGQAKFGNTSLYLDGGNDYLIVNNHQAYGTGPFTIEMFFRLNSVSDSRCLYDDRPDGASGDYISLIIASGAVNFYVGTTLKVDAGSISANTFYHIALCRSGTDTKLFLDGTQIGSTFSSDTTNYLNTGILRVGTNRGYNNDLAGYIDDFRISHMARYTSNFTAPSEPFADKGQ